MAVETAQPVIDTYRHELTLCLPDRGVEVEGDAVRLTQVVANLLTNAAKYTSGAGRIWLSLLRGTGSFPSCHEIRSSMRSSLSSSSSRRKAITWWRKRSSAACR
jgi:signal transduction histidine kinase